MSNSSAARRHTVRLGVQSLEAREVPASVTASASLQLINNSLAAPMSKVDVYANNVRIANDLSYQKATSFLKVPANQSVKIDITDWKAVNNSRPMASQTVRLSTGQNAIGVMAGDPTSKSPSTGFGISMMMGGRTKAANPNSTDILLFNGVSAMPLMDVRVERGNTLANDAVFGKFASNSNYTTVASSDIDLELMLGNGKTQVAEFDADLRGMRGKAMVIVATGRMQKGPGGPGLLAVQSNGESTLLPVSATDIQGSAGSDFFVVTSQSPGITQVLDAYTGTISEFMNATTPAIAIDALGGDNGLLVYAPNDEKLPDISFTGGSGVDVLYVIGSTGDDTISGTQIGNRVDVSAGFAKISYTGLDQLQIFAQEGNDRIDVSGLNSVTAVISGGDGDDTIIGGGGNDFLMGDSGNDSISGNAGNDTIFGGDGNDQLQGNDGDDLIFGEIGTDILDGGLGLDFLIDVDEDSVFIDL